MGAATHIEIETEFEAPSDFDDPGSGHREGRVRRRCAEIRRTHRRMRRRLDDALAADDTEADARLHEVRKAAKRVRYAAESAADILGARADELAARMETAEDTLGTHQDTVVIRDVVQTLAREADAADEASFTYGRLHGAEQQRGDETRATFLDVVDAGWARRPGWLG